MRIACREPGDIEQNPKSRIQETEKYKGPREEDKVEKGKTHATNLAQDPSHKQKRQRPIPTQARGTTSAADPSSHPATLRRRRPPSLLAITTTTARLSTHRHAAPKRPSNVITPRPRSGNLIAAIDPRRRHHRPAVARRAAARRAGHVVPRGPHAAIAPVPRPEAVAHAGAIDPAPDAAIVVLVEGALVRGHVGGRQQHGGRRGGTAEEQAHREVADQGAGGVGGERGQGVVCAGRFGSFGGGAAVGGGGVRVGGARGGGGGDRADGVGGVVALLRGGEEGVVGRGVAALARGHVVIVELGGSRLCVHVGAEHDNPAIALGGASGRGTHAVDGIERRVLGEVQHDAGWVHGCQRNVSLNRRRKAMGVLDETRRDDDIRYDCCVRRRWARAL
ncbi:hypothetical protein BT67DRAFT_179882 [Trichocladium antarcticum]|uniref:Uncharacterized protein n=1 Tax=Trichocladium antarcticum TaxID=1450529 RepID=A0AAN6UPB2_9PEZI|nr:hypothetical protein BT67DRAFT_179882 [Trichocladium antarcticum]